MASFDRIRGRLPALYRPEADDPSLLTLWLRGVGAELDAVNAVSSQVMQAHWFAYADRALYSPFFLRSRELNKLPLPKLTDETDRIAIDEFPYVHDLARLAALLGLPPWREPPYLRESVEEYRLRLGRMVELYRQGLGTLPALRRMVEAQLPVDLSAPSSQVDRPFRLEEFAPLAPRTIAVTQPGEPVDLVGPLMRWTLQNDGLAPAPVTLYIQGVTPQEPLIAPTTTPLIELYQQGSQQPRIGIAYRGSLAPGQTLRLRPAYTSWLGTPDGLLRADTGDADNMATDPTAPGPWQAPGDLPLALADATIVAIAQTTDQMLWFAVNPTETETGALWQYNGQSWREGLGALPRLHCVAVEGQRLWLGTARGLHQVDLYPAEGTAVVAEPVPALGDQPIYTLFQAQDSQWWIGAENGLWRRVVQADGTLSYQPFVLHESAGAALAIYAISQDQEATGQATLYFGTNLGVFQYQPGVNQWYWYAGAEHTEQQAEWQPFRPEATGEQRNFPTPERVFLPAVRAIKRGPEGSLWLGTDQGIARYTAQAGNGFTYETKLETFPDLLTAPVFAIRQDERGLLWFCTGRGLWRYDGRDWWQFQNTSGWVRLGRADTIYSTPTEERGAWRFDRTQSQWQRFDPATGLWNPFAGEVRSSAEAAVQTVAWADHVVAELGTGDGAQFTKTGDVNTANLVMRYKIDETRVVDGGFPAVPRLPVGESVWRYLMLEPPEYEEPAARPAWTPEGRLLPPPADRAAPPPGRYNLLIPPPASHFNQAVFAYPPAARVGFAWAASRALTVLVRLQKVSANEQIDPAILDRVWQGMHQVRPAGVRLALAVEEEVVRG